MHIENWRDLITWWLLSLAAAALVTAAKLGVILFGKAADPPADPVLSEHWARRRRWIAISEVLSLPAFATLSVVLVFYRKMDPVLSVLIAMGLAAIGTILLLDGAAWLFRKRLGMPMPAAELSAGGITDGPAA